MNALQCLAFLNNKTECRREELLRLNLGRNSEVVKIGKAIRDYREKGREAKLSGHSVETWEPTKMSNGETISQIIAHSKLRV